MSEEKKEVKVETEVKKPDLAKQIASIAFTVRKTKDWLEEKMGADIDGDGRIGGGPYKKALVFLLIAGLGFVGDVKADAKTNIANWGGTEANPITYIDQSGNIGAPSITVNNFTVRTNVTISGNATVSGAITGGSAKVIGSLIVGNGLTVNTNATVGGTLGVTGVGTFTAESVHNGGIDADYITTDAGLGIDAKTAGKLAVGTNTATSIDYGSVSVTAHTFVTDGTGTGEIVLPNESIGNAELASGIDAAKLLAASISSAIDGSSITNLGADKIASGTLDNARLDSDLQPLALDDGSGLTNLNGSSVASGTVADARLSSALQAVAANNGTALTGVVANSMSAAGLIAATAASAIDGNAITNLNGSSIASGTVPNARLDADLQPLAEDDGGGLTNIVSGGIVSLSADKLQAATVVSAIDISAATNANASELKSGTIPNARIVNLPASSLLAASVASAIDISAATNLPSAGITDLDAAKLTAGTIASAIDLSAGTNINGASIATGDIASDRMTANAVVVTDFTAANDVLVGTGSGTFVVVPGSATRVVTNASTFSTNVMYFGAGGVLTSNTYTGP